MSELSLMPTQRPKKSGKNDPEKDVLVIFGNWEMAATHFKSAHLLFNSSQWISCLCLATIAHEIMSKTAARYRGSSRREYLKSSIASNRGVSEREVQELMDRGKNIAKHGVRKDTLGYSLGADWRELARVFMSTVASEFWEFGLLELSESWRWITEHGDLDKAQDVMDFYRRQEAKITDLDRLAFLRPENDLFVKIGGDVDHPYWQKSQS